MNRLILSIHIPENGNPEIEVEASLKQVSKDEVEMYLGSAIHLVCKKLKLSFLGVISGFVTGDEYKINEQMKNFASEEELLKEKIYSSITKS